MNIKSDFIVYGRDNCPYCVKAKELLDSRGLQYEYIDVSENQDAREFIKSIGCTTVPQVFYDDDVYIGGYTELVKWVAEREPK